jgi:RimJ/RimL family protein N-acetyltransferase
MEDSGLASVDYPYSNGFAGVISLHSIDIPNHRAEIGYWMAKEARSKGIGTRAGSMITEYGLMTMGFNRIDGIVDVRNEPSKQLLLNAGYEFEGIMKKYVTRRDGSQLDMALFAATK